MQPRSCVLLFHTGNYGNDLRECDICSMMMMMISSYLAWLRENLEQLFVARWNGAGSFFVR
jgi:hypothetical protein